MFRGWGDFLKDTRVVIIRSAVFQVQAMLSWRHL